MAGKFPAARWTRVFRPARSVVTLLIYCMLILSDTYRIVNCFFEKINDKSSNKVDILRRLIFCGNQIAHIGAFSGKHVIVKILFPVNITGGDFGGNVFQRKTMKQSVEIF